MKTEFKTKLWLIFKLIIAAVALFIIYNKVRNKENIEALYQHWLNIQSADKYAPLLVTVFLMLVNWGIESLKWKILIADLVYVSFIKAFWATLSGVTISLFLPNRTGEFVGRVLHLDEEFRIQAALLTIVGSLSQMIVTLVAGNLVLFF